MSYYNYGVWGIDWSGLMDNANKQADLKPKRFWMIFDSQTSSIFNHRYQSRQEAETEAERIAAMSPGKVYMVMQTVSQTEMPKPKPTITVL